MSSRTHSPPAPHHRPGVSIQQQKQFDFNRATQLRLLEQALIITRGPGKSVLKALESFQRDNPDSYPSIRKLAENSGYDAKTVRRAVHELAALGLLTITPQLRPDGSYTSHRYAIQWSRILDLTPPFSDEGGTPTVGVGTPTVGVGYSQDGSSHHKRIIKRTKKRIHEGGMDGVLKIPFPEKPPDEKPLAEKQPGRKSWWGLSRPLSRGDLREARVLSQLLLYARSRGWIGPTDLDAIRFFALCHFCSEVGNRPGAFLTHLIAGAADAWSARLRQVDEDFAEGILRALRRAESATDGAEEGRETPRASGQRPPLVEDRESREEAECERERQRQMRALLAARLGVPK